MSVFNTHDSNGTTGISEEPSMFISPKATSLPSATRRGGEESSGPPGCSGLFPTAGRPWLVAHSICLKHYYI